MVETRPPPPRQFVAFNWLSLQEKKAAWAEKPMRLKIVGVMLSTGFVRFKLTTPAAMHIRPLRGREEGRGSSHGAQGGCREETRQ